MHTLDAPIASPDDTEVVRSSAEVALTCTMARAAVLKHATAAGYGPASLREWSTADGEGAAPCSASQLFYAALLPGNHDDDMPLGLGDTPKGALIDLLWTLAGPALLAAVQVGSPETAVDTSADATADATADAAHPSHSPCGQAQH